MRFTFPRFGRPHLAITATLCAAALVLYLQHRAITTLQSQTGVILRQISEQTADDIAHQVRRTLDGPVFDTLTAVNHPDLREGRLDLVAKQYREGLDTYAHVERFFIWHEQTESSAPGEVLFFGRDGGFTRDPLMGRAVVEIARKYAPEQHIYVVAEGVGPNRHQVFLRVFWTDARRVEYFAILGFVIDPVKLPERLFAALSGTSLDELMKRHGGDVPLELQITDDKGALVYGQPLEHPHSAEVSFPMQIYPADDIGSRLSGSLDAKPWTIRVSAMKPGSAVPSISLEYWPTVLSVLLMLFAVWKTAQANRRAADLARMQADFISHVSHQLKTPLSLLSAATETLAMDRVRTPAKMSQYLGTIRGEVLRLSALVQRILEFSRLQQPRSYEFEVLDLGPLVRETVDAFEHSLSSRNFTFAVEQERVTPFVLADSAAVEQALANLLDNAVKYSGDSRHVTVRVRASSGNAIIEVSDRGPGISDTDRRRIFEKFYRGAGASLHRHGFGIGLSIVQELVHAHHGRVEVESVVGQGSTFRIVLPAHSAIEELSTPATLEAREEAAR